MRKEARIMQMCPFWIRYMTNLNIAIAHIVQVNWTMTTKKFVLVLSAVVVYIGTEKFGNAQIVTIQKKINN